ncbi:DUF6343 family protein [Streptomyces sp. CB02058]|uniref:DUF6343 family protein n=1 Tax=Streptomyces sp. CB02058 TaxID=1703921 RepID=UPI003FD18C76
MTGRPSSRIPVPSSSQSAPRRPHRFPYAVPRVHAGEEAMVMRTGNEPSTARSPLRIRLSLSVWGMIWAAFGLTAFVAAGRPGWATACGVLLAITVTDFCLVLRHIRQGPRYQPGRNIPPYEPERDGPGKGAPRRNAPPYEPGRRDWGPYDRR